MRHEDKCDEKTPTSRAWEPCPGNVCTRGQVLHHREAGRWTRPPCGGPTKPFHTVPAFSLRGAVLKGLKIKPGSQVTVGKRGSILLVPPSSPATGEVEEMPPWGSMPMKEK